MHRYGIRHKDKDSKFNKGLNIVENIWWKIVFIEEFKESRDAMQWCGGTYSNKNLVNLLSLDGYSLSNLTDVYLPIYRYYQWSFARHLFKIIYLY